MDQPPSPRATQPLVRKALAYVTAGTRLLLLVHPDHPEAGIQVPAGTIRSGEEPGDAALREAQEESELRDLVLGSLLGREIFDMRPFGKAERQERWFWHVLVEGIPPERWTHTEEDPADGSGPVSVRILVDDVAESVDWYTRLFGFEVLNQFPAFADVKRGNLRLLLSGPESSAARPMWDGEKPGPGGWNRIHFIVDDIEAEIARLRQAGVEFRNEVVTGPGGSQVLAIDPSGNFVELFQPAEQTPR